MDEKTLRVKGGGNPTQPKGLALSMLHVLDKHGYVEVQSVGNLSLSITMKAYRIASYLIAKRSTDIILVIRQSEYTAEINGKNTLGINTKIFPILISLTI